LLAKTFAAGHRNNASGALTSVGTRGLYWASSSYAAGNINAAFLDFTSGNVNPLNTGNRADAFSVRCVQASTGCFLSFSAFRQKNRGGGNFFDQKYLTLQQVQMHRTLNPNTMKKILFLMAFAAWTWAGGIDAAAAQTLEPEFEGEVVAVLPDGSASKLEKHNVRIKTGAGVYIAGFAAAKQKTKVVIDGSTANVRLDGSQPIELIVRAKDNKADPMSIVRVFRMKATPKNRSAVISAVGTFNVQSNTMEYLPFEAKKYGESSYRLTFEKRPTGEYGVIVSNPNNVDEKMVIVSTFAIDNGSDPKKK